MPPRTRKAVEPTASEQLAKQLSDKLDELLERQRKNESQLEELAVLVNKLKVKVM